MSPRRIAKGGSPQPLCDLGPEIERLRAIIAGLLDEWAEADELARQYKLFQMALAGMGRLTGMVRAQAQLGQVNSSDAALEAVLQRMEQELGLRFE